MFALSAQQGIAEPSGHHSLKTLVLTKEAGTKAARVLLRAAGEVGNNLTCRLWWCTPVISAIYKAEAGGYQVRGRL